MGSVWKGTGSQKQMRWSAGAEQKDADWLRKHSVSKQLCSNSKAVRVCCQHNPQVALGQEVTFNRCAGEDAECECSSCVNEKEQHITGLLAILTIKLVILSNSEVLNAQISADEDELLIPEQVR